MQTTLSILIFIGMSIYSSLPAILANIGPFITKDLPFLGYPLDFNIQFMGMPLLGKNKTFRGLFFGILFSMITMYLLYAIRLLTGVQLTLYTFSEVNFHLLAFLMGFGVIFGDVCKSFFKRRFKVKPGDPFIPWDQIDCALGGLILGRIAWKYPLKYFIVVLISTFFLHILVRHMGYYLKLSNHKW